MFIFSIGVVWSVVSICIQQLSLGADYCCSVGLGEEGEVG